MAMTEIRQINQTAKSLQERLRTRLENYPESPAITFYNGHGDVQWLTFAHFYEQAAGYAAGLINRGLRKGDVCVLALESGEFSAKLLMSILQVGAVPLLMAPPLIQAKTAHSSLSEILIRIIRKTRARIAICPRNMLASAEELRKKCSNTCFLFNPDDMETSVLRVPSFECPSEDDIAAMQLTSGTTAFPRVCVWRQRNVLAGLDGMTAAMGLTNEDICLNWTPLYHDMGLVNNFLLCMTTGLPLVMLNPQDFVSKPELWLRGLSETKTTITWSPNFGFALAAQRVQDSQLRGVELKGVRAFWNAAERIHIETIRSFYERFKPFGLRYRALKTNFGCAENVGGATFSDPDGPLCYENVQRVDLHEKGIAVRTPESSPDCVSVVGVGKPYPGMSVTILSRTGQKLPEGHVGEVALTTPSRMDGYLRNAKSTRRALYGDYLRTGDLGYMRDGELFWVGRLRERITTRGKKLDPSDFEPILFGIDELRKGCFVAFGVDDPVQGTQRPVIIAELRDATNPNMEEITTKIRRKVFLQFGLQLAEVLLVPPGTLAKTSSGKRRHRHFKELYQQGNLLHKNPEVL